MRLRISTGILFLAAGFGCSASAQQSQPPAAPLTPAQVSAAREAKLNPALPTVFVVGDSTARNNADLGWGDHLAGQFDLSRINVANRARAGRSSRSYIAEGLWARTLAEVRPGDYVLIQMGHNDGAGSAESVLADVKRRTSLKGDGEETVEVPIVKPFSEGPFVGQANETVHSFGHNLRQMIAETRARGATPLLLTLTVRNIWKPCAAKPEAMCIERDLGYGAVLRQVAAETSTPLVDMSSCAADRFEALGQAATAAYFPVDHTHTSAAGAELNAECVAAALRSAKVPLAGYLLKR